MGTEEETYGKYCFRLEADLTWPNCIRKVLYTTRVSPEEGKS